MSSMENVFPLFAVVIVAQVAAFDARRFVAIERSLVQTETLQRRLHDLQHDVVLVASKFGHLVEVILMVIAGLCNGC